MNEAPGKLSPDAQGFHLKEYACLRSALDMTTQDYRALERDIVIAVGVTWAYLFNKCAQSWMYLISILFAGLGAIRGHGSYIAIKKFHACLQEIGCALSPQASWRLGPFPRQLQQQNRCIRR
jgi:hypothetical protein